MGIGPLAIGGLGGSGTRAAASIFQNLGIFIGQGQGQGLNVSLDNLWYVIFFGRRDVLLDSDEEFERNVALFARTMSNPSTLSESELELVTALSRQQRQQHTVRDLQAWTDQFLDHCKSGEPQEKWGWKVPYTFVIVERLYKILPNMRYVHLVRDGLDMALSKNRNQLRKWGPIYLARDVKDTPSDALAYWCAVHKHMERVAIRHPEQFYFLQYEDLVSHPEQQLTGLLRFLGYPSSAADILTLGKQIEKPASFGRSLTVDTDQFRPEDLDYALRWRAAGGYFEGSGSR